ncbi:hypothetical protein WJX84_011745 [Apatococcus fuscideae]|uniref:Secreted protein n=1 Tax=Apatococcus fuscideae TaxID=2026836 RepID=A0AAW1TCE9_9CHLO
MIGRTSAGHSGAGSAWQMICAQVLLRLLWASEELAAKTCGPCLPGQRFMAAAALAAHKLPELSVACMDHVHRSSQRDCSPPNVWRITNMPGLPRDNDFNWRVTIFGHTSAFL